MTKVTIDEVRSHLADQKFQAVDARAQHVWEQAENKAAGALRIPPDDAAQHLADLSRDDFVVTYCT